jgi:hypothetical protein
MKVCVRWTCWDLSNERILVGMGGRGRRWPCHYRDGPIVDSLIAVSRELTMGSHRIEVADFYCRKSAAAGFGPRLVRHG